MLIRRGFIALHFQYKYICNKTLDSFNTITFEIEKIIPFSILIELERWPGFTDEMFILFNSVKPILWKIVQN